MRSRVASRRRSCSSSGAAPPTCTLAGRRRGRCSARTRRWVCASRRTCARRRRSDRRRRAPPAARPPQPKAERAPMASARRARRTAPPLTPTPRGCRWQARPPSSILRCCGWSKCSRSATANSSSNGRGCPSRRAAGRTRRVCLPTPRHSLPLSRRAARRASLRRRGARRGVRRAWSGLRRRPRSRMAGCCGHTSSRASTGCSTRGGRGAT
mmetsp:Transcript_21078/g.67926  ORF Transcript_21078/g.67926 Transcript_21078/m.67926 type:complete len:211 (-) Transcript_21078:1844-2476(-)